MTKIILSHPNEILRVITRQITVVHQSRMTMSIIVLHHPDKMDMMRTVMNHGNQKETVMNHLVNQIETVTNHQWNQNEDITMNMMITIANHQL